MRVRKSLYFCENQFIFDKFHDISRNFSRLIEKGNSKGSNITEKMVRPICEANILSKYGPIKAFVDELRDIMLPKLNNNQYSLPGYGTPMAIFDLFDNINHIASQKKPMLIAIWDFSNAFCTFSHDALLKIIKED